MKKLTKYLILGLSLSYLTALKISYAQDSNSKAILESVSINLTGTVNEVTCNVSSSSPHKDIKLGTVATKELSFVGNQSTPVPIRFEMTGCPSNGTITINFTGTSDPTNTELLAISDSTNKAENIAVEIRDQNKERLALGKKSAPFIADQNGNALAIFYANYITTRSSAKAGVANATVNFSIEYQ